MRFILLTALFLSGCAELSRNVDPYTKRFPTDNFKAEVVHNDIAGLTAGMAGARGYVSPEYKADARSGWSSDPYFVNAVLGVACKYQSNPCEQQQSPYLLLSFVGQKYLLSYPTTLFVLADGERWSATAESIDRDYGGGLVQENPYFELTNEQAMGLAFSDSVKIQVGGVSSTVGFEDREEWRQLFSLIQMPEKSE